MDLPPRPHKRPISNISSIVVLAGVVIASLIAGISWKIDALAPSKIAHKSQSQNHPFRSDVFRREDYTCNKDRPCSNHACCGESGNCGYGPTYCGTGCTSNCNAVAECGKFASTAGQTCPLNVCCSEFGFCGTTTDFCGTGCQSNCGTPSPPAGASTQNVRNKVIGYYEAWSARRDCHSMSPSGIPIDGLTHVNFAFAYIEPGTYKVATMDSSTDANLFQQVADVKSLKSGNSDLEVFVSIGGWTFSDNNTVTQALFGEIAADAGNRQKFANNVVAFMDLYGFNGVDFDWEYPGAGDRGGSPEDTQNYVLLMKTLRETFDQKPRKYGLTFTIPSSYWYLRWFDLPNMLKYADWINMMSYDLHGFWDRNNPIGSIVQAHTNLTEIKLAMDLLWRNDVPPGKVVLGIGFYGRSFELVDPSCSAPGCPFAGTAANAGKCTNEGGILGYFEIQDIINDASSNSKSKRATIEPVHVANDAVNYFVYDTNQWVSYDDNTTLNQKVDWANSIGLGGLMTWSVDLDDSKFSALSSLVGRSIGTILPDDPNTLKKDGKDVSQHWAGQNGGQCIETDCQADFVGCASGMVSIGYSITGCGKEYRKEICCPVTAAPTQCQWRGGESGGLCNGQCHEGEVSLFKSSDGDGSHHHCTSGWQIFCCYSETWGDLIKACEYSDCDATSCPSGYDEVTQVYYPNNCKSRSGAPIEDTSGYKKFCCPTPTKFKNCHWVGKGDCADNTCSDTDIELMTDAFGDHNSHCRWGRQRVCCCNSPDDEDPFLPAPLKYLFPELPPPENTYKVDMQFPAGDSQHANPNRQTFGFILIDGPKSAVTSVGKRDGSHLEFLNCHEIDSTERQAVRYVCTNSGPDSNCDDIMEGGVAGTIVKMPDNCGPGTYAVAHEVGISKDQSLPPHIEGKLQNATVMELSFDYNFGLVRRDAGDIYMRIDFSNIPGYWSTIVNSPGNKRSIDKRYFSSSDGSWRTKIADVRSASGAYTLFNQDIRQSLYANSIPCSGGSPAFLDILTTGKLAARLRFGLTIIGTVQPWHVEESYAFVDGEIDLNVNHEISSYGNAQLTGAKTAKLWKTPATKAIFSHPGIGVFTPFLNAEVGMVADIPLAGNFTTGYHAYTDGYLTQVYPSTVESPNGAAKLDPINSPFDGQVYDGKQGRLKIEMRPVLGLDIEMNKYGNTGDLLDATIEGALDTYSNVEFGSDGSYVVSMGSGAATTSLLYASGGTDTFPQWDSDDDATKVVGPAPGAKQLVAGSPGNGSNPGNSGGPKPHYIEFDTTALFAKSNILSCASGLKSSSKIKCAKSWCTMFPDECEDDDSDTATLTRRQKRDERSTLRTLEKRGNKRWYAIRIRINGQSKIIRWQSEAYPSVGQFPWGAPGVFDDAFDLHDWDDCTDPTVDAMDMRANNAYVTEHILELQTIQQFFQASYSGTLPTGRTANTPTIPAEFFQNGLNNQIMNNPPVLPGGWNSNIPAHRIMEAMGSTANIPHFVVAERDLNALKGRLWGLQDPIVGANAMEVITNNPDDPSILLTPIRDAIAVFRYLNHNEVQTRMIATANDVRTQLQLIQNAWNGVQGNQQIQLVAFWDEFIRDFFAELTTWAQTLVNELLNYGTGTYGPRTGQLAIDALQDINDLITEAQNLNINTAGLL